jgi:hypothetical protein
MLLPSSWRLDWSKLTAAGRSEFAGWRPLAGCARRAVLPMRGRRFRAICREAMATGRTIATMDRGVANRILDVRPNAIVRASDEARTPDGQGAPVTRAMVDHIWHNLTDSGHASRLGGVLFFAYALVAEIPGVAVDNDRYGLHIADWDLAMTPYREGDGVGATTSDRRYWTLAAHPARYRVVDAVRELDEDWWLTGGADLHAGDRVAIWKYKGPDDRRGIIAFGEVLTDPEMRDLSAGNRTYWIDSDANAAAPRVRVRYVIRPSEPLWLELAPADSVIHQLPVSRAQGGTAHHVTSDQWAQLMALVGGWPQLNADEHDRAAPWADTEIQLAVASYFTMLRAELAGHPYVKADLNRQVRAATGRSHGAVEYKFANISAVLRDIGLPYVLGYQPRGNYRSALRAEVERFLGRDPEIPRLLEEMPAPDLPNGAARGGRSTSHGFARHRRPRPDSGRRRLSRAPSAQPRCRPQGERLVVEHERAWLSARGQPDLAELVVHVPSTLGDGAGYDVSSFLLDGSHHHIEVKATRGGITAPFFLSATELRHVLQHPEAYSIYRIFDLGPNPKFYKLTGDIEESLTLRLFRIRRGSRHPEHASARLRGSRPLTGRCGYQRIVPGAEHPATAIQLPSFAQCNSTGLRSAEDAGVGGPGRMTETDVPPPGRPWIQAVPPWSSARRRTNARPIASPGGWTKVVLS